MTHTTEQLEAMLAAATPGKPITVEMASKLPAITAELIAARRKLEAAERLAKAGGDMVDAGFPISDAEQSGAHYRMIAALCEWEAAK